MDSLSRSAYVIYLVHYAYVLWLQRALLGLDLDAGPKFLIVFLGTAFLSWFSAQCLLRISLLRTVL
jgi:glucan biosynthesis protein C